MELSPSVALQHVCFSLLVQWGSQVISLVLLPIRVVGAWSCPGVYAVLSGEPHCAVGWGEVGGCCILEAPR